MENIYQVLAGVADWKGLAGWLNTRSNDIETKCAQEDAQASCYRKELIRRYCDRQLSENPHKVAEDIAEALEHMDHNLQAQKLRSLEFGEPVTDTLNLAVHQVAGMVCLPCHVYVLSSCATAILMANQMSMASGNDKI